MTISMQTFSFLLIFLILLQETKCEQCIKQSSCSCYGPGYEISLSALDTDQQRPRFDHLTSTLTPNMTFAYNPCSSFVLGNGSKQGSCSQPGGVAVCLFDGTEYVSLGTQDSVSFSFNTSTLQEDIVYKDDTNNRLTFVSLKCVQSDQIHSTLTLNGVLTTSDNQIQYFMTLSSLCACPNGCLVLEGDDSSLSFGSLLVLLFFSGIFVYFLFGILFLYYVQGAQGWEIVPHYEFWLELPSLIRDGITFTLNGCKTEAMYSRI